MLYFSSTIHGFAVFDIVAIIPVDFVLEFRLQVGATADLVVFCESIPALGESHVKKG
jgi:hypothetical protein